LRDVDVPDGDKKEGDNMDFFVSGEGEYADLIFDDQGDKIFGSQMDA
jgi:hypothetical protein